MIFPLNILYIVQILIHLLTLTEKLLSSFIGHIYWYQKSHTLQLNIVHGVISSSLKPRYFIFNRIPGLEPAHIWISMPFWLMYITAVIGNCGLIYLICYEEALHWPMYYFLAFLSLTDAGGYILFVPNTLCIFWLSLREIDFNAWLVQMFFIHMLTDMESGMLMLMALCRYVTICYPLCYSSLVGQIVKNLPAMWEIRVRSLGQEDPLEKELATHSSILAWKIPWTEEPGRLQSMWLQRVRHDWATNTHTWYSSILTNTIITKVDLVTWLEVCCLYHSLSWSSVFPTAKATSFNTLAECSQTCCEHMSLATLSCGNIKNNAIYGFIVAMVIGGFDIFCIFMSYTIFICVVGNLSSADARHKDFSTCISHICAVVITYVPVFFTHHFGGHSILHHIHILIAKLYLLLPPTLNPIVYWVKTKQICEEVIKLFF